MKLEPVASVHVSHFRQSPAMRNIEWEEISTIPDGSHKLYTIPPGYVLAPVRLLEEIMQSLDGMPMSMRSRGDARIAKDVSALIEGEQ